jgi:hypothetical protein
MQTLTLILSYPILPSMLPAFLSGFASYYIFGIVMVWYHKHVCRGIERMK